ncbi:hypothetical protein ADL27_37105, partial [Streptomyces sp. NRRL F-6602]
VTSPARASVVTTVRTRLSASIQATRSRGSAGSTGRPKAVLGLHGGLLSRWAWFADRYPEERDAVVLAKSSVGFLDSVTELLGTYKTLNERGFDIVWVFVWIAVGYLILTLAISALFNYLEHRWGVPR